MQQLGMGVIGIGFMGSLHAKIYSELPNTKLIAIADVNKERLSKASQKLGVPGYVDYNQLLQLSEISAVSICVSDTLHTPAAIAAAKSDKHLLIEKPMATNIGDIDTIIQVARNHGIKLMVGHLLRFDPQYAALKRAIICGELGELVYLCSRRNSPVTEGPVRYERSDTSLTLHVAIHDLDLIRWYVGSKVERVYAESAVKVLKNKGFQDVILAILRFKDGTIASLEYSWILPEKSPTKLDARMEVVGTTGVAYINTFHGGLSICGKTGVRHPDILNWPEIHGQTVGNLREELMHFVNCIINDRSPLVSGEEAREGVRLALTISQSIAEKRQINL